MQELRQCLHLSAQPLKEPSDKLGLGSEMTCGGDQDNGRHNRALGELESGKDESRGREGLWERGECESCKRLYAQGGRFRA